MKKNPKAGLPFYVDNGVLVINNQVPFRLDAIQTAQHSAGNSYVSILFAGTSDVMNVGTGNEAQAKWLQATLAEWMSKQPRPR